MVEQKNTSLEQLASGAAIAIFWSVLGFGFAFLFKLFAARYFGPHDFGVYSLLETVFGLLVLVGVLGVPNGLPRFFAIYREKNQQNLLRGYWVFFSRLLLILGVLLGIVIILFASQITSFFNFPLEFASYLKLIAVIVPFAILSKLFQGVLISHKKIGSSKFASSVLDKSILLFGFFFIWLFNLSLWWFVLLFSIAKLTPFLYVLFESKPLFPKKIKPTFKHRLWLSFTTPLLFSGFFGYIFLWVDNFVVGKFLGPSFLGVYSIVFSLASLLTFFQGSFASIFLVIGAEKYARKLKKDLSLLFSKQISWVFGLSLPLFLLLVLFSKEILSLIYGSEFSTGSLALIILSCGFLINISTGFGSYVLLLYKKTKTILFVNLFFAALNLTLNIFLVPTHGIAGAAIATATSVILQQITFFYFAQHYEKLFIEWVYLGKFLLAGFIATIGIFFARYMFNNIFLKIIVGLILFCMIYVICVFLFKTLREEDFRVLLFFEKKLGISFKFLKTIVKKIYSL